MKQALQSSDYCWELYSSDDIYQPNANYGISRAKDNIYPKP